MRFNWTDNVVMRALGKMGDMICLNVMWVICCIPIITIGASTTALYTVMLRMVKNEEGYIFRGFLKAFKSNFKQSTLIWLILLLLGIVWTVDFRVAGFMPGDGRNHTQRDLSGARLYSALSDDLHIPADCKI